MIMSSNFILPQCVFLPKEAVGLQHKCCLSLLQSPMLSVLQHLFHLNRLSRSEQKQQTPCWHSLVRQYVKQTLTLSLSCPQSYSVTAIGYCTKQKFSYITKQFLIASTIIAHYQIEHVLKDIPDIQLSMSSGCLSDNFL